MQKWRTTVTITVRNTIFSLLRIGNILWTSFFPMTLHFRQIFGIFIKIQFKLNMTHTNDCIYFSVAFIPVVKVAVGNSMH